MPPIPQHNPIQAIARPSLVESVRSRTAPLATPMAPLKRPWPSRAQMAIPNEVLVPKRMRVMALPSRELNRTILRPCLLETLDQSKEVRNWDRKKTEETIPAQNPTAASPPPTPKSSIMKKMNGPDTDAERNSEIMAKHSTTMGSVGRGVESC